MDGKKKRKEGEFMHEGREEQRKENSKKLHEVLLKITSALNHTNRAEIHSGESSGRAETFCRMHEGEQ